MSIEDKFYAAVNVIRSLPKNGSYQPSNELMLRFYAFYKQATEGSVKCDRPSFWEVVKRAKWDAWKRLGSMPKEEAMTAYVEELNKIVETMAYTDNVADFLSGIDTFYTSLPAADLEMCIGPALQKVRSLPDSPLGSREASPIRGKNKGIMFDERTREEGGEEDEDEEEDFLDTFEQTITEKEETKKAVEQSLFCNGILANGKINAGDVIIVKTVEAMKADIDAVNQRLMGLEEKFKLIDWRGKFWGGLPGQAVTFIIIWPILLNFVLFYLWKRKTSR